MAEKKKKPNNYEDAVEHIKRIRMFGPRLYKKSDVLKILQFFVETYVKRR